MGRRRGLIAVLLAVGLLVLPVAVGAASHPRATSCAPTLPAAMATTDGARQLLTVVAATRASTTAAITDWQRAGGCWFAAHGPWIGRVGVTGVRVRKREGDGATPAGLFFLYSTIYGNASNPGVHLRYRRLRCGDWWDEDVASPQYDSFEQVPCDATPAFANGASEPLWRSPRSYAWFAVIGYNPARVPGRGSGIFLHVSVGAPTRGCVALAPSLLVRTLEWLRPGARIAIATRSTIDRL